MAESTVVQRLTVALGHHKSGRLAEAETHYRQILAGDPNNPDALHLLGVLYSQSQKYEAASDLIQRAIRVKPDFPEAYLSMGVALQQQGLLDEAVGRFQRAAAIRPNYGEAQYHLGCALREKGDIAEAIACFRRALALKPTLVQALIDLGGLLQRSDQLDEAIVCYRRAIVIWPGNPMAHFNLAVALQSGQQLDQAAAAYRQALAIKPDFVEARNNLASVLRDQGLFDQAIEQCRVVLTSRPEFFEAHNTLGNLLRDMGRFDEAIVSYRRVLELRPDIAEAHNNIGSILEHEDQLDEAANCYRQALSLKADLAEAHNNLGNVLRKQGHIDEAMACFGRAVTLRPDLVEAHLNLGNAHREKLELEKAVACYRLTLMLKPAYAEAHFALGMAMKLGGQPEAAIGCFRLALELKPGDAETHGNLGTVLMDQGQLDEAIEQYRLALVGNPRLSAAHGNLVYALALHPDSTAEDIFQEQQRFGEQQGVPLRGKIQVHENERSPERRLRVGYVSPDFRNHAVGWNVLPLFRERDREKFEVICYSNVQTADSYTERFRQSADGWRDISALDDDQAARIVREDRIDILVDLALHTNGNRLMLFGRKPAPVQVSFAGYPGGTGLGTIDYRLTDPYLDPPGESDRFYVERSVRLPDCFWCYDPQAMGVAELERVNPLPALTNGRITFGCLNNVWKINDRVLSLWATVMAAVPNSRLIMLVKGEKHRRRICDHLERLGVAAERIEFVGFQPREDYLRTYERIDLGLDCFPYNGHTTSLDAFWMGVPVITLIGQTVVGRAGFSQLCNLGLRELAAETPESFLKIVQSLTQDVPRLAELRGGLRQRMLQSALTDAVRFTRNIELAYRQMWRNW